MHAADATGMGIICEMAGTLQHATHSSRTDLDMHYERDTHRNIGQPWTYCGVSYETKAEGDRGGFGMGNVTPHLDGGLL